MRCDDFDNIVCELARDGLMDAAVQDKALSHAAACDRCSSRLAGERFLNEALAIAAAAETECAPLSVRLALLQAFAARESTASPGPAPNIKSRRSTWYAVGAAAALLAVISVISLRVIVPRTPGPAPAPNPAPEASYRTGTASLTPPRLDHSDGPGSVTSKGGNKTVSRKHKVASHSLQFADAPVASSDSDALSDFIPLTHLSSSTAIESGQVIRGKVPLSAFLALGLPVSPEHADDLVNAELVVGDDGVRRAIRLIK